MVEKPAPYPSWTQLRAVAAAQRRVLILFLVGLAANVLASPLAAGAGKAGPILVILGVIALAIAMVISVYRLAATLGSGAAWLWAATCWLSFLGLIVILILNGRATRLLKRSGLKVGLLGVGALPATPPPGVRTADVADVFG